ncbi:hypothetical protein [Elongatibacter sediminis]|uniref:Peptidase MA-like domain-containing protein n=1 Tax=Elongatibacter sediminis TaxID=3119006 RepID=A0AAW9RB57_9GAMM
MRRMLFLLLLFCHPVCAASTYDVRFSAQFEPDTGFAMASITVDQDEHQLMLMDLAAPAGRFTDFTGDGKITRDGRRLVWKVPASGGRLSYRVQVDHRRGSRYDARLAPDWAVLRLGDLFPPARTVTMDGAESVSTLTLRGPKKWTFETRYGPVRGPLPVPNKTRRFDRPTGWLAAGRQGIRRETIAERRVVVAGPLNQGVRRLDILTFLRWTLPRLVRIFPAFPQQVLIVSAADEMWRGALSGPDSLYLHADRPLVSENGTSTLLHELVHVGARASTRGADDWIVEGLAEFYSLEILRRSGGLSQARYQQAFERLERWAKRENGRLTSPSSGPDTARATLLFRALDEELNDAEAGGLDAVARRLLEHGPIRIERLDELLRKALDGPSAVLDRHLEAFAEPEPASAP